MHNKLTVALVASVISFALTGLAKNPLSMTYCAAVLALLVAFCWTVWYFFLGHQLRGVCLVDGMSDEAVSSCETTSVRSS